MTKSTVMLDFVSPTMEMFDRDGEKPKEAVIATTPTHSTQVQSALKQLTETLMEVIDPEDIFIMEEEEVVMSNGTVIPLHDDLLFFSLVYPTAQGRTYEMELAAPESATLH